MLLPTLDALAFLHRNKLVHGHLRPSNVLVVDDQLKLSSDNARPIGNVTDGGVRNSSYDPPELKVGVISAAGDVWALGMTLVEALTQHSPAWVDERNNMGALSAGLPAPFADTARRCLSVIPAGRIGIAELASQFKPAPPVEPVPVPEEPASETPHEDAPAQDTPRRRALLPAIAAAILVAIVAFVGVRSFHERRGTNEPTPAADASATTAYPAAAAPEPATKLTASGAPAVTAPAAPAPNVTAPPLPARVVHAPAAHAPTLPAPAVHASAGHASTLPAHVVHAPAAQAPTAHAPAAATTPSAAGTTAGTTAESISARSSARPPYKTSLPPDQPPLPQVTTSPAVLHEASPDIPRGIRDRIRGHVNVTVRVLVDPSGNVVGEFLENPGPSRYFARRASEAAGEWKFAPADSRGSRV